MKQIKKIYLIVIILFGVSSISPLLVPFSISKDGNMNIIGYITGIMFWTGLILGILGYILLEKKWKETFNRKVESKQKKISSALRFFSNPHAKIVDSVMFVGIAGVIYSIVNIDVSEWIAVIFLMMMLAGIYGHFLVNGNIYEKILDYMEIKNPNKEKGKKHDRKEKRF